MIYSTRAQLCPRFRLANFDPEPPPSAHTMDGNPLPFPRVLVQDSKSISAEQANAAVEGFLASFAARSTAENKNNSITHQLQNLSAALGDEARRASKKAKA
ncbi:hypothetical protein PENSPDRAFT_688569 [Peniophora sp. CONT]|nr:hypothetical protein PENSPDRAFT_688569 [Peniophora sp. CONT]